MKEYQISVSFKGCFMFRTEWDSDHTRVKAAAVAIQSSMVLAEVRVTSRSKLMNDETESMLRAKE